jgi:cold shock CspA family protein
MVGIIKKVNLQGVGIIATAKGEKVPFVLSDVLNQLTLRPGERVVFSLRVAKGKMFAWNIVPMPINHQG